MKYPQNSEHELHHEHFSKVMKELTATDLDLDNSVKYTLVNSTCPGHTANERLFTSIFSRDDISDPLISVRRHILPVIERVYPIPQVFKVEAAEFANDKYINALRVDAAPNQRELCSNILYKHWSNNLNTDTLESLKMIRNSLGEYEIVTTLLMNPAVASVLTLPVFVISVRVLYSKGFQIEIIDALIKSIESRGSIISMTKKYILPTAIGTSSGIIAFLGMRSLLNSETTPFNPYRFSGFAGDLISGIQSLGSKIVYNLIDTVSKIRSAGLQAIIDSISDMISENIKKVNTKLK